MWYAVITTTDKQIFTCPAVTTGPDILALLGVRSVTLGKTIPLNNGTIHRTFRFIGPQTARVDLAQYADIFLSNKLWFASIAAAEVA